VNARRGVDPLKPDNAPEGLPVIQTGWGPPATRVTATATGSSCQWARVAGKTRSLAVNPRRTRRPACSSIAFGRADSRIHRARKSAASAILTSGRRTHVVPPGKAVPPCREKKGAARVSQVLDVLDGHASLGLDHPTWSLGLDHQRPYRSITDDRSFLYAGALEVRE